MAVTQNTYTGNGSTTNYSFTFPYLEPTDVKVLLNGVLTTAYTFANATTIQFNAAPANGATIDILRSTDDSSLQATFYPGSAIRSVDLNDNFTQNLYVTQEANREAALAVSKSFDAVNTADTATATAISAVATADASLSTAQSAVSTAQGAVATANAASSVAASAVSTANTATSTANSAVTTADAATATSTTALNTANTAAADATDAVNTANTALSAATTAVTTADAAVTTANAAASDAADAVTTANLAANEASSATSTANLASAEASTASDTANTALIIANVAASTVATAILYETIPDVSSIPLSPDDGDAIELADSTGIENFSPLSGLPSGFVGDSGLSVRLVYSNSGQAWTWIQYYPNDPENRYGDSIVTLQTSVAAVESDVALLQADLSTAQGDILGLDNTKLDSSVASSTYQTQAGMSAYLTASVAGTTYAPLASPTFTGTVVIPAGASISGYLTTASAASIYQSQVAMAPYLTSAAANDAFASKGVAIALSIALG